MKYLLALIMTSVMLLLSACGYSTTHVHHTVVHHVYHSPVHVVHHHTVVHHSTVVHHTVVHHYSTTVRKTVSLKKH